MMCDDFFITLIDDYEVGHTKEASEYCYLHMQHQDFVYSDGVCIDPVPHLNVEIFPGFDTSCDQFSSCIKNMTTKIRPKCDMVVPSLDHHDFYQVWACTFKALHGNITVFNNFRRRYDRLPFLQKHQNGTWTCLIYEESFFRGYNSSCPNFYSSYCNIIVDCLAILPPLNRTHHRDKIVYYDNLAVETLRLWRLHVKRSYCYQKMKKDYFHVVKHLNFPNHVAPLRSQGHFICYWNPFSTQKFTAEVEILEWLRVIQQQCNDLRECMNGGGNIPCEESLFQSRLKSWAVSTGLQWDQINKALTRYSHMFKFYLFDRPLFHYPSVSHSCRLKAQDVSFLSNKVNRELSYNGFVCVKKTPTLPCDSFFEQCHSLKECIEKPRVCDSPKITPISFRNKMTSSTLLYSMAGDVEEAIAMKCKQLPGTQSLVVYPNTHNCYMMNTMDCGRFHRFCDQMLDCYQSVNLCAYDGHPEELRGMKLQLKIQFQSSLAPKIRQCNLEYGFKHFVSMKHERFEREEFTVLVKKDYLITHLDENAIPILSEDEGDWLCVRREFANMTCDEFIAICQAIAKCIENYDNDTDDESLGETQFHVKRLDDTKPEKCYEATRGLLMSSLDTYMEYMEQREYIWPDVFSEKINDVDFMSALTSRVVIMSCATVFVNMDKSSTSFDKIETDFILEECAMKLLEDSPVKFFGSIGDTILTIRCCPSFIPWEELSCDKWMSDCNKVVSCFDNWRINYMPMQEKMLAIFHAKESRNLALAIFLSTTLCRVLDRYLKRKEFEFLNFAIDWMSLVWMYFMSMMFDFSAWVSQIPVVTQLNLVWISQCLLPLVVFSLAYYQSYVNIKRYCTIILTLKNINNGDDHENAWRFGCSGLMLLNGMRLLLDASIIASLCSLFLSPSFDALSYAGDSETMAKLADRHAMIRLKNENLLNTYFLYHPSCYKLSQSMSHSWPFFIFFVGVDSLALLVIPAVLKSVNIYLVVTNVRKSNEFRKKANVRVISLCSYNFASLLLDLITNLSLALLYFIGVAPLLWNDPRGIFMDKNLNFVKFLFFSYNLLYSFMRRVCDIPLKWMVNCHLQEQNDR